MKPELLIDSSLDPCPTLPALVWAEGLATTHHAEGTPPFIAEILSRVKEAGDHFLPDETKQAVRQMLKFGKYRASGRGKPASEFLLGAALGGGFPLINGPVDVNNAVSLESGYPGSIFDMDRSGEVLLLRRGLPGESYVFNPSGQSIDLADLLLLCRRQGETWEPCGNPVKDAMATKIGEGSRHVIAVLYAPRREDPSRVERFARRFAELLRSHCGAVHSEYRLIL